MRKPAKVIEIESIVRKDLSPGVTLAWGREKGTFTPAEARAHAFAILEAACAADMDAAIAQWVKLRMQRDLSMAGMLISALREAREAGVIPSCSLALGDESLTPDAVRDRGVFLIENAFNAEAEALVGFYLLKEVGVSEEAMEVSISELRDIRGLVTTPQEDDAYPKKETPDDE